RLAVSKPAGSWWWPACATRKTAARRRSQAEPPPRRGSPPDHLLLRARERRFAPTSKGGVLRVSRRAALRGKLYLARGDATTEVAHPVVSVLGGGEPVE